MQQDFHQPLFVLADDTVRLAEQMLGKGVRISTECKERFLWRALLSAFLLKACRSLHAIVLLCREGFYYDAAVVARSIAEIAIMADWIAKDSNERSRLFVTHIPVEQKRFVQRLEAAGERIPAAREALERNPEAIEELRQQHDEMGGDSRHRYRWAGCNMTLRRMAAEVNYGDLYDFIYWLFSQRAPDPGKSPHAGMKGSLPQVPNQEAHKRTAEESG